MRQLVIIVLKKLLRIKLKEKWCFAIRINKNDDILAYLGKHKTNQIICGFAMETKILYWSCKEKFIKKNCDLLVANNLKEPGAGFKNDTNKVTFITKDKSNKLN